MTDTITLPASWAGIKPTPEQFAEVLRLHKDWYFGRPGGVRADMTDAIMTRADMTGAIMTDAIMTRADMTGAIMTGAIMTDADMTDAIMTDDIVLPDGIAWKDYVEKLVPALCIAGGRALDEVANPRAWDCHSWENCPMHAAFGAEGIAQVPPLYRAQANLFVQLYDARLLELERVNPGVTERFAATGNAALCEVSA